MPWITPYLGTVDSNLGTGYMYELVRNADGSPSKCITPSDREKCPEQVAEKVANMYRQLVDAHAVANDFKLENIMVRIKDDGDFDLILVDGFGNNNFIKIADYSKYFLIKS